MMLIHCFHKSLDELYQRWALNPCKQVVHWWTGWELEQTGGKAKGTKLLPHNPRHSCAATLQEQEGWGCLCLFCAFKTCSRHLPLCWGASWCKWQSSFLFFFASQVFQCLHSKSSSLGLNLPKHSRAVTAIMWGLTLTPWNQQRLRMKTMVQHMPDPPWKSGMPRQEQQEDARRWGEQEGDAEPGEKLQGGLDDCTPCWKQGINICN